MGCVRVLFAIKLIELLDLIAKRFIDFLRAGVVIPARKIRFQIFLEHRVDVAVRQIAAQAGAGHGVIVLVANGHRQHQAVFNFPLVEDLVHIAVDGLGAGQIDHNQSYRSPCAPLCGRASAVQLLNRNRVQRAR